MTQDKTQRDKEQKNEELLTSPTRGPMKGMPDDQTPAIDQAGDYTADQLRDDQSQESQQAEGRPNQGTESR